MGTGSDILSKLNFVAHVGWLEALEDLDKAPDYDWGPAILAELYCGMDRASVGEDNFTGFWRIIEYWWYTYFRVGKPILKDGTLRFPMLDMYMTNNLEKKIGSDLLGSSFVHRLHQMTRSHSNVVVHPYIDLPQYGDDVGVSIIDYSMRRVVFYSPESKRGVWYLGERVQYQIQGIFAIAINPLQQMQTSASDYHRL